MNLCSRMQPVRLLMHLQRQQKMKVLFSQSYLTKPTATAMPSFAPIYSSGQGSISSISCRPTSKVFTSNSALPNKSWPALFYPQSQEIFTHSALLTRQGIGRDPEEVSANPQLSNAAWGVRLANENGFLSWCRNSYLATAVGVGMNANGTTPLATLAYETVFLVSGLNLTLGTSVFIFNILKLRHQMGLSTIGAAGFAGGAFSHLLLWLFGLLSYSGYLVDDSETDTQHKCKPQK